MKMKKNINPEDDCFNVANYKKEKDAATLKTERTLAASTG
jgi:hypothetical protein